MSIKFWIFFSVIIHIFASYTFYISFKIIDKSSKFIDHGLSKLISFVPIIYLLFPILISGYGHFSTTATAFLSISLNIKILERATLKKNKYLCKILFFISFISGCIAISIRPYFIPVFSMFVFWIKLRNFSSVINKDRRNLKCILKDFLIWNTKIFIITILINFLPFFMSGNAGLVIDGLKLNSQNLNPQTLNTIAYAGLSILKQKTIILLILVSLISYFINFPLTKLPKIYFKFNYQNKIDFLFLCILMPLSVALMILTKHYWKHYALFLTPFITYFIFFILRFSTRRKKLFFHDQLQKENFFGILLISPFLLQAFINIYKSDPKYLMSNSIKNELIKEFIVKFSLKNFNEISFIDLTSQEIHLKLKHSRNGVSHPAHIRHISLGWYQNHKVKVPNNLIDKFPLDNYELLEQIEKSEKKIIISKDKARINKLFDNSKIFTRVDNKELSFLKSHQNFKELVIFKRSN